MTPLPSNSNSDDTFQRWYDRDPALSRALEHLRTAEDRFQAQIALNMIQIIVEHQLEAEAQVPAENLTHGLQTSTLPEPEPGMRRRWYDMHETLRSAMELLKDCPDDLQRTIIPTIARMIEQTLDARF